MCGNIKRKRDIRLSQTWKKSSYGNILTSFGFLFISVYSNIGLTWFLWPRKEDLNIFFFFFWGRNWGLEDLKLCNLPKLQNLQYKAKTDLEVDPLLKNGNWHFIFSFLGSMCFRILNVINIKGIQRQPYFWLLENLIFHEFLRVFIFYGSLRT